MTTQYVNKATLNGTSTVYWVTSGAPDSTGAQSGYNPVNLTNIAVDYTTNVGVTTTGGQTLSTNSWITALDLDFTQQPTQTLGTDGTVTIAGLSWTKINSANERTATVLTNGTGIVWSPTSTGDYYSGIRTLPGLTISLSSIIPNFTLDTPVRVWMYESSSNETASYDSCVIGVERPTSNTNYAMKRTYFGSQGINATSNYNGGNQGQTNSTGVYSYNVMVMEILGVCTRKCNYFIGSYASGFPSVNNLHQLANLNDGSGASDIQYMGQSSDWNFLIGAHRAGSSNNSYTATIARIKIEYIAQQSTTFASGVLSDGYANLPTAGAAGKLFFPTNGTAIYRDNGVTWNAFGPVYAYSPVPNISTFTSYHLSDATVANTNGAIYFQSPNSAGSTQNLQGYEQSKTNGQSLTAAIIPHYYPGSGVLGGVGIYVRDNVGGTLSAFNILQYSDNGIWVVVDRFNNATSYNSSPFKTILPGGVSRPVWLRIRDDGTNFNYEYSFDSQNYWTVYSEARAAFVSGGGNVFGFYNTPYSIKVAQTIVSWKIG